MKFYYIISFSFSLLFFGCSSTYRVSDFPSKEKFYENFNKSTKDKTLKIILNNDSTFTADNGAKISNDSLIITIKVRMEEQIISKSEISAIEYGSHNTANTVIFTNGKSIEAKQIKILPDSIVAINYEIAYVDFPLNKVEEISYKDHNAGVLFPAIIGTVTGPGFGALIAVVINYINPPNFSGGQTGSRSSGIEEGNIDLGLIIGPVIGFVTGAIIGYLIGKTYIYEFNP